MHLCTHKLQLFEALPLPSLNIVLQSGTAFTECVNKGEKCGKNVHITVLVKMSFFKVSVPLQNYKIKADHNSQEKNMVTAKVHNVPNKAVP